MTFGLHLYSSIPTSSRGADAGWAGKRGTFSHEIKLME
jgi:hypothetical protein